MKAGFRLEFRQKLIGLSNDVDNRRYFASPHLFERLGVIHIDAFCVDTQPVEQDTAGQVGGAALRIEADFLASQICETLDFGARVNVHLSQEEADDVIDPVADIARFAVTLEIVEHIGLRDGDIDALQIQKVFDVADRAVRYDGQNAQVGRVVEYIADLGRKADERAFEQTAREADGPLVHALDRSTFTDE